RREDGRRVDVVRRATLDHDYVDLRARGPRHGEVSVVAGDGDAVGRRPGAAVDPDLGVAGESELAARAGRAAVVDVAGVRGRPLVARGRRGRRPRGRGDAAGERRDGAGNRAGDD